MTQDLKLRESTEIQGDILAGFKKDHVTLLFLKFEEAQRARTWLRWLTPRIATTKQVAAFNKAFSEARRTSGGDDPKTLKAVWHGVSFTYSGLQLLSGADPVPGDAAGTTLGAFKEGAARRAGALGDSGQSAPEKWIFGNGTGQAIHAVVTVAADTPQDLAAAVTDQREAAAQAKAVIVFQQNGATLPGSRRGKEHFGFKDGISEPGVAGFDEPDPEHPQWVKDHPGTRIIPAGEFVVGLPPVGGTVPVMPGWALNGSFQVVRRLAQDVPGWWAQVAVQLQVLREAKTVAQDATVEWLAARLVGRWRSGTPISKCPFADAPNDPDASTDNDLTFRGDELGHITPLFSHLRKTNPRDGLVVTPGGQPLPEEQVVDNRRIIRRGIPYGQPFDPASEGPGGPDSPRGLVFVCYQSDLVKQFEFIQADWVNSLNFPPRPKPPADEDRRPGHDPMIGSSGRVTFEGVSESGENIYQELQFQQFVHTEGAVYSFAPSLSTLRLLGAGKLPA
ncbi:Dyp-type peroxidase [Kitasatospora camelliae]|uniref:Dyp-type peroxidase n=1 Tax=Kitasatospora camelliae TaxID=3156397 RepID=A0AAU8JPC2_9ACTN